MSEPQMDPLLEKLVARARSLFGDALVSVVLYGSAAEPGEHDAAFSDLNLVCVLSRVDGAHLGPAQKFFAWCAAQGVPAPLLLGESEIAGASRCFAIEFRDMERRRRVLAGADLFSGIHVDELFYRAQVEYELRSKLIRLRQRAAAVFDQKKLLARLLLDSVTTFCVLIRHALLVQGADLATVRSLDRRGSLRLAGEQFGFKPDTFLELLDARQTKAKRAAVKPGDLIGDYIKQIETVTDAVSGLAKPAAAGATGEA